MHRSWMLGSSKVGVCLFPRTLAMKVALFGATGGTSPGPYGFSVRGFEFLAWEPGLTVCMTLLWCMNEVIACFTLCVRVSRASVVSVT